MASVNKVILVGNLGKDPAIRGEGDKKTANFSIATSYGVGDSAKTDWHNIVLWGKLAGVAESFLKKGNPVYIEGRLQYRTYEKDGETKYITEVVGQSLQLLGKKEAKSEDEGDSDLPF
jgi:single-strand DNA-binding protein